MLKTRVLSALFFTPIVLGVIYYGGAALSGMVLLSTQLALWEFLRLTGVFSLSPLGLCAHLGAAGMTAAVAQPTESAFLPLVLPFTLLLTLLGTLARPQPLTSSLDRAARTFLGLVWCGGLLPCLCLLRARPGDGQALALASFLCTWAGDTGAYFAGRAFGRTKLYPAVSPNKTLEGALGGMLLAASVGWALFTLFHADDAARLGATLGAVAAVMGTLGDLCESLLKRAVGAKDSSQLIPGHGGVLDRFDGVLFAIPSVYGLTRLLAW